MSSPRFISFLEEYILFLPDLIFFVVFYHFNWLNLTTQNQKRSLPLYNAVTNYDKNTNDSNWHNLPPFYERCCNLIGCATCSLFVYKYWVKCVARMISYYSMKKWACLIAEIWKTLLFRMQLDQSLSIAVHDRNFEPINS